MKRMRWIASEGREVPVAGSMVSILRSDGGIYNVVFFVLLDGVRSSESPKQIARDLGMS
jgi:hypothetical protein